MPYPGIGTVFAVNGKQPARAPYHDRPFLLRDLPDAAARVLLEQAGPGADCPLLITELRHLGGALDRASPDTSPVSTQGAQFLLSPAGVGGTEHAGRFNAYQAALAGAMAPWALRRKPLNFLSGEETAPAPSSGPTHRTPTSAPPQSNGNLIRTTCSGSATTSPRPPPERPLGRQGPAPHAAADAARASCSVQPHRTTRRCPPGESLIMVHGRPHGRTRQKGTSAHEHTGHYRVLR